jgi:uncharacterized membrane protein YhaH (DUF805 family)
MLGRDLERGAIEAERIVGRISRTVFWVLFLIYAAILGVGGWFLYQKVLGPDGSNPNLIPDQDKNVVIIVLAVIVLGIMMAGITRDGIRNRFYNKQLGKK